jgi:hypothetical protein
MCRVIVTAWGADASNYAGRSLTLFCDPKVKWGGMEVGGIRISHMSHIDSSLTMALTVTRANKKPFTVKPLVAAKKPAAPQDVHQVGASTGPETSAVSQLDAVEPEAAAGPTETITPDQAIAIEARCKENSIKVALVKEAYGVKLFSQMTPVQFAEANAEIDVTLAKRKAKANS